MSQWNPYRSKPLLLSFPHHDRSLLPVPRRMTRKHSLSESLFRSLQDTKRDLQVVNEFRQKLRVAEDLISKLAFSLREIQGARKKPKKRKAPTGRIAAIQSLGRSRK